MILVFDTETGGFEGTSLLTAYFRVIDTDFNVVDELELFMKPVDGIYHVTGEALEVNHINLIEHNKKAITYREAGTSLFNFLYKNTIQYPIRDSFEKLEPLGHNVSGDIRMIKEHLIAPGSWDKFVSYRVQDTGTVGNFLKRQGKIPKDVSGSLSSYCKYFGIDCSNAHDAKADSIMTLNVYKEMLKL